MHSLLVFLRLMPIRQKVRIVAIACIVATFATPADDGATLVFNFLLIINHHQLELL